MSLYQIISAADVAKFWGQVDPWNPLAPENIQLTESVARAASDYLEAWLSRKLILRHYELTVPVWADRILTEQWPVVEVIEPVGATVSWENEITLPAGYEGRLVYFAGYRREDQSLADFQAVYNDLTKEPPVLPGHFTYAACQIAIEMLKEMRNIHAGDEVRVEHFGQVVVTTRSTLRMDRILDVLVGNERRLA